MDMKFVVTDLETSRLSIHPLPKHYVCFCNIWVSRSFILSNIMYAYQVKIFDLFNVSHPYYMC